MGQGLQAVEVGITRRLCSTLLFDIDPMRRGDEDGWHTVKGPCGWTARTACGGVPSGARAGGISTEPGEPMSGGGGERLRPRRQPVPHRYSTPRRFLLLGALPLTTRPGSRIGTGLPTFHAAAADRARVAFMPDTTWPVSGHPPDSSRRQPETPVLMSCSIISTRPQRFTRVRLPGPHLTPHWAPCPHRSPPRPHGQRSMRWFGASPTQGDSEGPLLHQQHSTALGNDHLHVAPPAFVAHQVLIIAPRRGARRRALHPHLGSRQPWAGGSMCSRSVRTSVTAR